MLDIVRKRLGRSGTKATSVPQYKITVLILSVRWLSCCGAYRVSDAALDLERDLFLSLLYFNPLVILSCDLCTFIGLFVEDCRDFPFM